jgi:hypothetical protein
MSCTRRVAPGKEHHGYPQPAQPVGPHGRAVVHRACPGCIR